MAALAPVKPSEVEALIPAEGATICQMLVNLLKLTWLVYKIVRWKYQADGTLSDDYRLWICSIECPTITTEEEETEQAT